MWCAIKQSPHSACATFRQLEGPYKETYDSKSEKTPDSQLDFQVFRRNNIEKTPDHFLNVVCDRTESSRSACAKNTQCGALYAGIIDLCSEKFCQICQEQLCFQVSIAKKKLSDDNENNRSSRANFFAGLSKLHCTLPEAEFKKKNFMIKNELFRKKSKRLFGLGAENFRAFGEHFLTGLSKLHCKSS